MTAELNYKHLYYFWVAAKEGGMSHAAARLGMAVQTVSAQVRLLEQSLGHALFKPAGRGLVLTEAGQTALKLAEQIFLIGEQLPAAVRDAATQHAVRLVVGISDGLPKLAVCGGGALNDHLMRRLAALLPGTQVLSTADAGLPPLQVEAAAFAWLARKALRGESLALESTTGARGARVLGCIYPA